MAKKIIDEISGEVLADVKIIDTHKKNKSHLTKFVQYSVNEKQYKKDDELLNKSPLAYRIFKYIITYMDKKTGSLICSYKVLTEEYNVSRQTVYTAIKLLVKKKYISIVKVGNMNCYCINPNIVWGDYKENVKHAMFNTNLIITSSEQTNEMNEYIDTRTQIKTTKQAQVN